MASMAAPLLVEYDWNLGTLVYSTHLESADEAADEPALQLRPSQHPLVRWPVEQKVGVLAVSGSTILGIADGSPVMVIHDTARHAAAPGPQLRQPKRRPAMVPVGDDTVVVMDTLLRPGGSCRFEALRRLPDGRWRADPLPEPPIGDDSSSDDEEEEDEDDCPYVITSYFAAGPRVWISVTLRGTFSMDLERRAWRVEGDWELPLQDHGLFVPGLGGGGSVVIGVTSGLGLGELPGQRCCQVCALDVEARPPAVRRVWQFPAERPQDVPAGEKVSVAYLGNGRICVSRSVTVELSKVIGTSFKGTGTSFTVADADGELQLAKVGTAHCHVWPFGHFGQSSFLQPAP